MGTEKKDRNLLYFVIYCIIASLGWIIPPVDPITPAGMHLLGVFLAAVVAWTVTAEPWPSFLTIVLIPFTGITDLAGLLSSSWGSDIGFFLVLLFAYVAFMESTGTTTYIAAYLMTRKFLVGHPWRLIFMIFLTAWVLSTFCSNFPGMLITWGIIYKICQILGYKPFDKFPTLLIFGVAVMGALSLSTVPWANNAIVILGAYMKMTGNMVNFGHYLLYTIPYGLSVIFAYMLMCKYLFKLDVSKLRELDPNVFTEEELRLTAERKITLVSLVVFILILLVPSLMPLDSPVRAVSDTMGLSLKVALLFVVLSLIKVDGKKVFEFGKLAVKGVPWNMIIMVVGILSFVMLLGSPEAGISAFLGKVFTPIFAGKSVILFFILVALITIFLTNFMINMVVAIIMISATLPIATSLGIDPIQIVYLITVCCTIALLLPAASPASSVLFANTQWVRAKDVYKYGIPTVLMMALFALLWNVLIFLF